VTALAVVGLLLFGVAVVAIAVGYGIRGLREYREMRRIGVLARLTMLAAEHERATKQQRTRKDVRPTPDVADRSGRSLARERQSAPAPPGWGFDSDDST
jgi:predicted lipid-binding transport protein (Tim44 family)